MCPWRPEIAIGDRHGQHDRENIHQKREEQVLGDQRHVDGRRRKNLRNKKQENDKSKKDRDTHGHLLAGVCGQVEHTDTEERDKNAGYDEVHGVEERLATDLHCKCDPSVTVSVASELYLVVSRTRNNVPRSTTHVVAQIHLFLTFVPQGSRTFS